MKIIYYHLHRSTKRKKHIREFMNINNTELRKVTNHTCTRLLSLGKCPGKTLMQWDSLESHFLFNFDLDEDSAESEPDENPSREKRLVNYSKNLLASCIPCSSSLQFQYLIVLIPSCKLRNHWFQELLIYYIILLCFCIAHYF